jgi:hypothetical protein
VSAFVGRHGAINPAGRVRIRNIMPIAGDYSHASQWLKIEHFVTAITSAEAMAWHIGDRDPSCGRTPMHKITLSAVAATVIATGGNQTGGRPRPLREEVWGVRRGGECSRARAYLTDDPRSEDPNDLLEMNG